MLAAHLDTQYSHPQKFHGQSVKMRHTYIKD